MNNDTVWIRRMEERDVDEVMLIERNSFSVPWHREDFLEFLAKESSIYLVAVYDDQIVGYCGLDGIVGEGQINNVAVSKEYRGHGIAYEMVSELIRIGQTEKLMAFTLEVRVSNAPAIALYTKLGFENAGIRKNYYTMPKEDAMIMWRYPQGE